VADSPLDVLVRVLDCDALRPRALNPKVSRELERVCLRCLEKVPARRYSSAAALADNLERLLRGDPLQLPLADTGSRLRHWARNEPALVVRLGTLALCATISELGYRLIPPSDQTTPEELEQLWVAHLLIMAVMGTWLVASLVCQRAVNRPAWAKAARFAWVGADVILLTVAMHIDDALESPLVGLYVVLVAASALWSRVSLVLLTTQLCALGYLSLVAANWLEGRLVHPHWHLIFIVALSFTGLIVAYQVHRLSILGRFCDSPAST
jgi:hypothetical protein